ncbi:MAG: hypothetical protein PF569_06445 [Candidatus Woesearchaeota archaeon]|jgi:hypothetical protein|nr:hypothetical protein [Candidatus Woesearchaeota archaeon]
MSKKKHTYCCKCKHKYTKEENKRPPKLCPNCNIRYWDKPNVECDLALLQDRYLEDREANLESFQEMMIIIEQLLHNIISSKLKSSAVYLEDEKRHDLVMTSLVSFMEKYINNPNFKISGSFIGYLQTHVLNPMYNPKKKQRELLETSINTPITSDNSLYLFHLIEVVEGMVGSEEYILNKYQEELQIEAITYLLDNLFIKCVVNYDLKTAIIVLRSIYMQIDPNIKDEDIVDYWEYYSNHHHMLSEFSMKSIYDFIREEIVMTNQVISYEEYTKKFGRESEEEENNTIISNNEEVI